MNVADFETRSSVHLSTERDQFMTDLARKCDDYIASLNSSSTYDRGRLDAVQWFQKWVKDDREAAEAAASAAVVTAREHDPEAKKSLLAAALDVAYAFIIAIGFLLLFCLAVASIVGFFEKELADERKVVTTELYNTTDRLARLESVVDVFYRSYLDHADKPSALFTSVQPQAIFFCGASGLKSVSLTPPEDVVPPYVWDMNAFAAACKQAK